MNAAHVLRDVGEPHPHAALVLLEHLGKRLALAVEYDARARQLEVLELVVVRQVRRGLVVEIDDVAEIDDWTIDRVSLAELPVRRVQIGEVDTAQHLGPGDRLRIVHCSRDQVVDIDVVEFERLEHVGATRMQDLGDLRLIPLAVELGLHGVGGRRHLAQRERGGEQFDEERFHSLAAVNLTTSVARRTESGLLAEGPFPLSNFLTLELGHIRLNRFHL
jgi:hypothetical protein